VCWKPCSSCWSLHLLQEEFLSASIHSPSLVRRFGPSLFRGLGGYWDLWSNSRSLQHSGLRRGTLDWNSFKDHGSLDLCFYHHKAYDVSTRGLQLLHGADDISAIYIPSTTVASGGIASVPGATVSAWGRGVHSSIAGDGFSLVAAMLGSSPSQDRSIDFLHSTNLVVNQARLPRYKYYSGMVFTYKLDRTTVTVGAPSMLAISTSPASAGASSSAWAATGSLAPVVALGSGLLSSAGTCGSAILVVCCAICGTGSSTVGAELRLLSVGSPTVPQSSFSP
jgi:hypothetical protein